MERLEILRKVAEKSLNMYDIECQELDFLVEETNVYFKIKTTAGENFALKIFQEESSNLDDNRAEVYFLSCLKDVETPAVLMNRESEGITVVESEYTDTPKRIAIYSWMEGEDMDGRESPENFYKLGKLAAHLHGQTVDLKIPSDINPKKWDKVFYYPEEKAVYHEEKYAKFLTEETAAILDEIIPLLDDKLSSLYNGEKPQLIHADLNPWNVKIFEDKLRVLDFEEAMYGLPVHDMAVILYYYRNDENFNYTEVKEQLIKGYNEVYPKVSFDDDALEMLMIARRVNFLNYSLYIDDDPADYVKMCTGILKIYLKTLK